MRLGFLEQYRKGGVIETLSATIIPQQPDPSTVIPCVSKCTDPSASSGALESVSMESEETPYLKCDISVVSDGMSFIKLFLSLIILSDDEPPLWKPLNIVEIRRDIIRQATLYGSN
ncbi:unnamed protein product [Dicrocoelium dendriticum]|nr:unnamed protein product [Dicrocoelium dendriticum]